MRSEALVPIIVNRDGFRCSCACPLNDAPWCGLDSDARDIGKGGVYMRTALCIRLEKRAQRLRDRASVRTVDGRNARPYDEIER